MTDLNVTFFEVEGSSSPKLKNAWVYWRVGSSKLILRVDGAGAVFKFTSGDPKKVESYKDPFITPDGVDVKIAYNSGSDQLTEDGITARLTAHKTQQSISATLSTVPPVKAAPGAKKTVKVPPVAEIKLPKSHKFLRAIAVTRFGGVASDVHARNMDRFLDANYGTPGGTKQFQGDEEKGFRDELRRVVSASGPEPINIIRDIKSAAETLKTDDADERIVALALHGNVDRIGRRLVGFFLVEDTLRDLQTIKSDFDLKTKNLKKAQDKLDKAQADGDPDAIDAARLEVESRKADLETIDATAREMLEAFSASAEALKASGVKTVELQACDSGGTPTQVAAFGFLSRLSSFLSAKGHTVAVKGHQASIFTELLSGAVTVWIGSSTQKNSPGTQTSKTSLPLP